MASEEPRRIPIHRSLVRPQQIMGCERFLFIGLTGFTLLLAFMGGIMSGNLQNCIVGVTLFWGGTGVLAHMAKRDPHMSSVYLRSMFYKHEYPACGTVLYTLRKTNHRKRWDSKT